MDMTSVINEIKLKLTGNLIKIELDDATLMSVVNAALREIQRYIDSTKLITIPYKSCIDLSEYNVNAVARVFRAEGYAVSSADTDANSASSSIADPMYMGMWQMMSGNGNLYNINDWTYNYAAWNTALQTRNTLSTDLLFRYDRHTSQLYINCSFDQPEKITVEYIPRYNDVSEIVSDFWIDMLINLATALTKVTLGRVRTRYTQSNAQWSQDGETLLTEGNAELDSLREQMKQSTNLFYPID